MNKTAGELLLNHKSRSRTCALKDYFANLKVVARSRAGIFRLLHSPGFWLAFLAVSLIFAYSFVNRSIAVEVAGSPDEDATLFFSQHIVDTSSLTWHSDLNDEFGVSYFRPRLAKEVGQNTYTGPYPQFEMTIALARLYGVLDWFIGLAAVFGVLGLYLLGRELAGNKAAMIAAFIFGFLPAFLLDANKFMSMVPAVSFAIFAIFCLFKAIRTGRGAYYYLSAVLLAGAALIRADFALLALPVLVALVINRSKISYKHFAFGLIVYIALVGPWYFYIYRILPSLTTRPFSLPLSAHIMAILENLGAYPFTFSNYLVLNPLPLSMIGLPALLWIALSQKNSGLRTFAWFSITLLVLYLGAYGARTGTWAFWQVSSDSSMFRYFLLPYAILALCFSIFITHKIATSSRFLTWFTLLALLLPFIAVSSANQLIEDRTRLEQYARIKSCVEDLPENSVLFTKSWDKVAGSGKSNLAVYRTYEEVEQDPDLAYFFKPADIDRDIVPLVGRLLDSGRKVYVLADDSLLAESLKVHGYEVTPVPQVGYSVQPGQSIPVSSNGL